MDSWNHPAEVRMQEVLTARTVYVNRNFNRENTKVLVNPNFKHSVHINPNFSANVYVNPSVLQSLPKPVPPAVKPAPVQVSRFSKINVSAGGSVKGKCDAYRVNNVQAEIKMVRAVPYKSNNAQAEIKMVQAVAYKSNKFQNENILIRNSGAYKISKLQETKNRIVNCSLKKADPYKINKLHSENVVQKSMESNCVITKFHKVNCSKSVLKYISTDSKMNLQADLEKRNKLKRDFSTKNLKLVKPDSVNKFNLNRRLSPVKNRYTINKRQIILNKNDSVSKYRLIHYRKQVSENKTSKQITENKNKYKLVHANNKKSPLLNNKFKLDNRVDKSKLLKLNAKAYLMNVDPQREIIKRKFCKSRRSPKVVKVNSSVYRFSENRDVLRKITRSTKFDASKIKKNIVINGVAYVQKDSLTYVRKYANNLVKINSKVLKKDNNPCLVFRRTGRCDLHTKGRCIKQHNPKQISICIRFLQGACHDKNCLLSHDVSPEKMPTCKYFLEGCCSNDDCQYLHVKLGRNAEICKDFLEGYCMNGIHCMKKHQFLCPTYEKTGSCGKRSCPYPHGEAVRQCTDKLLNKIARSTKCKPTKKSRVVEKCAETAEPDPSVRYYKEETAGCSSCGDNEGYVRKPKVGELPSFIGFDD